MRWGCSYSLQGGSVLMGDIFRASRAKGKSVVGSVAIVNILEVGMKG